MNDIAYFEAHTWNGQWVGTGTRAAIEKAGLIPDTRYILWGPESWSTHGWACLAK